VSDFREGASIGTHSLVSQFELSKEGKPVTVVWGHVPWRKSAALMVREGSLIETLAYFRDEESLTRFTEAITTLFGTAVRDND
jgi:hypothetical protein